MNPWQIAIIVPVYQQPKRLAGIIRKILANNYVRKELIVAVDGATTPEIESILDPWRNAITIHYNQDHIGKALTLNRIALQAQADVLLFLDNDIEMSERTDFLDLVAGNMERYDLLEIPKQALASNWLSQMAAFEFLDYAIMSWLLTRIAGHCPAMNGAAFAVRKQWFEKLSGFRRVVNEDSDFAARAFRLWARYGYVPELQVHNEVPTNLRHWFRQRKRWAINNLLWLKDHWLMVAAQSLKSPQVLLCLFAFSLPFLVLPLLFVTLHSSHLTVVLPMLFIIIRQIHGLAGVFLLVAHYHLVIHGGWLPSAAALAVAVAFHYGFARLLKFNFNVWYFLAFYFFYAPLWILVNLAIWIWVVATGRADVDWKT